MQVAIQTLQEGFNQNKTFEEIYPLAVTICISVVNRIHFDGEYMCPGLVSAYGPVVSQGLTYICFMMN